MRYFVVCFLVVVLCASCSLFSGLRKRNFTFTANGKPQTLRMQVPKRYAKKQNLVDSAGRQQQLYTYSNGALLYVVYTTDTLVQFQPIDTTVNVPKPFGNSGLMYKGLDSARLFWREVRTDSFRVGYRYVPQEMEIVFDSAVNYSGQLRFKH